MDPLEVIPLEIIEKILCYLDTRNLCTIAQVSKRYYDVSTRCPLWKNVRISKKAVVKYGVLKLLSVPRFSNVKSIDLSKLWIPAEGWNALLSDIRHSKQIEYLDVSYLNLNKLNDLDLLGDALASIKRLKMSYVEASGAELSRLLMKILVNKKTKEIYLDGTDLTEISDMLFEKLLDELDYLDIIHSHLSRDQARCFKTKSEIRAKVAFRCEGGDIHDSMTVCDDVIIMDFIPDLFKKLRKLELKLNFSEISTDIWCNLFSCMSESLESLLIAGMGINLVNVPGNLISSCFCRIKDLSLSGLDLTAEQWEIFFKQLSLRTSKLSLRMINLSGVDVNQIIRALKQVKSLSLNYVCLSTVQWEMLFSSCFPHIPNLSVVKVNLSEIQEECLVQTVRKAVHLCLSSSYLSPVQQEATFRAALQNQALKSLDLSDVVLSGVPQDLLANAVAGIKSVNLSSSKLQSKQLIALYSRMLGNSKLRELELRFQNNSGVPPKILALAISRLRKVNLNCSILSRDQLIEICSQIQDNYSALEMISMSRNNLLFPGELKTLSSYVYIDLD